jgi:hypothetical protein
MEFNTLAETRSLIIRLLKEEKLLAEKGGINDSFFLIDSIELFQFKLKRL